MSGDAGGENPSNVDRDVARVSLVERKGERAVGNRFFVRAVCLPSTGDGREALFLFAFGIISEKKPLENLRRWDELLELATCSDDASGVSGADRRHSIVFIVLLCDTGMQMTLPCQLPRFLLRASVCELPMLLSNMSQHMVQYDLCSKRLHVALFLESLYCSIKRNNIPPHTIK